MLYIWPYFLFFSWPIIVSPLLNALLPRSFIPKFLQRDGYLSSKNSPLPRLAVVSGFILTALVIVHLNTIVHPFTLADNRHYVFYVFRILLRHTAVKYLVTPIYFISAWAVLSAVFNRPGLSETAASTNSRSPNQPVSETHPVETELQRKLKQKLDRHQPQPRETSTTTEHRSSSPSPSPSSSSTPTPTAPKIRVSFLLIWLISTALSVITAPLVEPRYFIIPWVIWRLHIPSTTTTTVTTSSSKPKTGTNRQHKDTNSHLPLTCLLKHLSPLLLETIWLITINAITGYVFLYRGFEWPQEPGKVQRFLW